jgi:hypothetical protein
MADQSHQLAEAIDLFRTGQTVWLAKPPYLSQPIVTARIPCGRTLAFSLGRAVDGVLPTVREIADDLLAGQQQISRMLKRAA